jgi:predicted site-specific integrase-resolvase
MTTPQSARATAAALGISTDVLLRLHRSGAVPAVIHEGRLIRFDLEEVRAALAQRARANASAAQKSAALGLVPTL